MRKLFYGIRHGFTLALTLCCGTVITQANGCASFWGDFCVDSAHAGVKAISDEQRSVKLLLPGSAYHPDSSEHRIDHLANRRHGSNSAVAYTYNADRFAFPHKIPAAEILVPSRSDTPWSRLQLMLNDRWLLDADFSSTDSMNHVNSRGFMATPRLRYEYRSLKLITRYIPRIQDYNNTAVMAIYLIILF